MAEKTNRKPGDAIPYLDALTICGQAESILQCVAERLQCGLVFAAIPLVRLLNTIGNKAANRGQLDDGQQFYCDLYHPIAVLEAAVDTTGTTDTADELEAVWGALTLLKQAQQLVDDANERHPSQVGAA